MFHFATSDPVRAQLLFQRTIPGFEPSPESYAPAVETVERVRSLMVAHGITDPQAMDLWTAMIGGLVAQQLSNDPGGSRWARLVDRTVDMFLAEMAPTHEITTTPKGADEMTTTVEEVADRIYRLSTYVPDIGPTGFTFNQFLIDDEEPLLFHTGPRGMFPLVSEAVSRVVPLAGLRWITFGHLEADECGAMNDFLAAAPHAQVAHGAVGCLVSLNDLADRPPVALADGETLELGSHRIRHLDTPHVPHGWDARVLYDEGTRTLLSGDLGAQLGNGPAITSDPSIVEAASMAEDAFGATCLTPQTAATIRRLAALEPATLAIMHGSSYTGDGAGVLRALADDYDARLAAATPTGLTDRPSTLDIRAPTNGGKSCRHSTTTRRPFTWTPTRGPSTR